MSRDYSFWKYQQGAEHEDQRVYMAASAGEVLAELQELPIDTIRVRLHQVFADWDWLDKNSCEGENLGSFELFTTPQFVRFDCYVMSENSLNLFIDLMTDEFGIPLYDPQISTRFDSWTDI